MICERVATEDGEARNSRITYQGSRTELNDEANATGHERAAGAVKRCLLYYREWW